MHTFYRLKTFFQCKPCYRIVNKNNFWIIQKKSLLGWRFVGKFYNRVNAIETVELLNYMSNKKQTLKEFYQENKEACDSNGKTLKVSGLDYARSIYKSDNASKQTES